MNILFLEKDELRERMRSQRWKPGCGQAGLSSLLVINGWFFSWEIKVSIEIYFQKLKANRDWERNNGKIMQKSKLTQFMDLPKAAKGICFVYIWLNVQYLKFIRIVICVVIRNTAFIIKAESCGHRRKKKSSAVYCFFFYSVFCLEHLFFFFCD